MRTILKAALLCALAAGGPAAAAPNIQGIACPGEDVRIVVLGDSLADGLWGALYRALGACDRAQVVRGTRVSDGLVKTDAASWAIRVNGQADLVVVQMGANDITNIRDGRTRLVYGSPAWRDAYEARARELAGALKEKADRVIWMGLPVVGQTKYEPEYREISALQAEAATQAGIEFVDTHEPTTFGEGEFVSSTKIDGLTQQVRITDLVHFTELGYDIVAGLIREDVESLFARTARDATLGAMPLQ